MSQDIQELRRQAIYDALAAQRNRALDEVAMANAEIHVLRARVAELEAQLPKPQE